MAASAGTPPQGIPEAESRPTDAGAGTADQGLRDDDRHEKPSQQADQTGRALSQIEKSLQALHQSVETLGQRFDTHIHQPVEVRSDATPKPSEGATPETKAEPASEPAQPAAPVPAADTPPPAPKRATGIGPMKHRKGRRG